MPDQLCIGGTWRATSEARADTVIAGLDVGMIGVNETALAAAASPFGGVHLSGYGREGGTESLETCTVRP